MKGKTRILFLLAVIVVMVLIDQWTKALVLKNFALNESVSIIANYFNLTYVRNTGAAFGLLATADPAFRIPFFLIVPAVALVAIVMIFKKLPPNDWKLSIALALVMAGAIGNLIDRVRFGFVVDFLDFHWRYQAHYPTFNVADIAICVGVGLLMLDLVLQKETHVSSAV